MNTLIALQKLASGASDVHESRAFGKKNPEHQSLLSKAEHATAQAQHAGTQAKKTNNDHGTAQKAHSEAAQNHQHVLDNLSKHKVSPNVTKLHERLRDHHKTQSDWHGMRHDVTRLRHHEAADALETLKHVAEQEETTYMEPGLSPTDKESPFIVKEKEEHDKARGYKVAGFSYAVDDAWFLFLGNKPFNVDTIDAINRSEITFKDEDGKSHTDLGLKLLEYRSSPPMTYALEKTGWVRETMVHVSFPKGTQVLKTLQAIGKKFGFKKVTQEEGHRPPVNVKLAASGLPGDPPGSQEEDFEPPHTLPAPTAQDEHTSSLESLGNGKYAYNLITAAAGLYGYPRGIQGACEKCIQRLTRVASGLARKVWESDENTAPFLQAHGKKANSLPARILVAAMKGLGPKLAEETDPEVAKYASEVTKTAGTAKHGLYGFSSKTANLGLNACNSLREAAGDIAGGLNSRRADKHKDITGFFQRHASEGKCAYSDLLACSYPDSEMRMASTLADGLAWEE